MSVVEEIRTANLAYANSWTKGQLPLPPARKVAIVTVSPLVVVVSICGESLFYVVAQY